MTLIGMETRLNNIIKSDEITDEVYILLRDMMKLLILRKKLLTDSREIEEISLEYAGDMYVKILKGFRVQYWISYTSKVVMRYIQSYRDSYCSPVIDAEGDNELAQAIIDMSYASGQSYQDEYDYTINKIFLKDIIKTIEESFRKNCRYLEGSKEYNNLYLSVLLSIAKNKYIYYDLSQELSDYLSIIFTKVKMSVVKSITQTIKYNTDDIQSAIKVLAMENYEK